MKKTSTNRLEVKLRKAEIALDSVDDNSLEKVYAVNKISQL